MMHCHLHRGDWSFHLMNEKKKKKVCELVVSLCSMPIQVVWSPEANAKFRGVCMYLYVHVVVHMDQHCDLHRCNYHEHMFTF